MLNEIVVSVETPEVPEAEDDDFVSAASSSSAEKADKAPPPCAINVSKQFLPFALFHFFMIPMFYPRFMRFSI